MQTALAKYLWKKSNVSVFIKTTPSKKYAHFADVQFFSHIFLYVTWKKFTINLNKFIMMLECSAIKNILRHTFYKFIYC